MLSLPPITSGRLHQNNLTVNTNQTLLNNGLKNDSHRSYNSRQNTQISQGINNFSRAPYSVQLDSRRGEDYNDPRLRMSPYPSGSIPTQMSENPIMTDYNNYPDNGSYYLPVTAQAYAQAQGGLPASYYQIPSSNLQMGYYPEYQPAYYSAIMPPPRPLPPFKTEGEDSEKLLGLIERQTEVIGHLNSKILSQESKKLLWEKKQLNIRLKQLELANAAKQKELESRLLTKPVIKIPPKPKVEITESPRKVQSSRMLQLLSKLVIEKEIVNNKENEDRKPKLFDTLLGSLNPQGAQILETAFRKKQKQKSQVQAKKQPQSIVFPDSDEDEN